MAVLAFVSLRIMLLLLLKMLSSLMSREGEVTTTALVHIFRGPGLRHEPRFRSCRNGAVDARPAHRYFAIATNVDIMPAPSPRPTPVLIVGKLGLPREAGGAGGAGRVLVARGSGPGAGHDAPGAGDGHGGDEPALRKGVRNAPRAVPQPLVHRGRGEKREWFGPGCGRLVLLLLLLLGGPGSVGIATLL